MAIRRHTVVLDVDGEYFKICKIFFGNDGSYYLTCPYHEEARAFLTKFTVNYAEQESLIPIGDALEVAVVEDDDRRLKLSHHPDGFLQFSGEGISSGRYPDGRPKGLGVLSWPLGRPIQGPAFGMTIFGYEHFDRADAVGTNDIVFRGDEVDFTADGNALHLEGHYFPDLWRRFVRTNAEGRKFIPILHPAGAVLHLKVIFPPQNLALQNFFGLELYSAAGEFHSASGFFISGSTGNLRRNEKGELLGDGIYAMYPSGPFDASQHLDFRRQHAAYVAPSHVEPSDQAVDVSPSPPEPFSEPEPAPPPQDER